MVTSQYYHVCIIFLGIIFIIVNNNKLCCVNEANMEIALKNAKIWYFLNAY